MQLKFKIEMLLSETRAFPGEHSTFNVEMPAGKAVY